MTHTDTSQTKWRANPGSKVALEIGCTCAVMDNNNGIQAPHPPDGWWITMGCPCHSPPELNDMIDDVIQEPAFAEQEL